MSGRLPKIVELDDGERVLIRPIRFDDKARLASGLRRLSEETIRRRFLAGKPRFSSSELRYLTEVDGHQHLAYVAVPYDNPGDIIGVARAVRLSPGGRTAEMAIVIGDPWQRRGLGKKLARVLTDACLAEGVDHFAGTMLGENLAARRLIAHIAARFEQDRIAGGLREVVVELATVA